jgi:predicted nucleic acid-binding protein
MPGADPRSDPAIGVLDASVAIKWLTSEPASLEAAALFDRPIRWLAPRLLLTEAAAALRRKVTERHIQEVAAISALTILLEAVSAGKIVLANDEDLIATALSLALLLGHRVPDCLYLTIAEREGAALATADAGLAAVARGRGVAVLAIGAALA